MDFELVVKAFNRVQPYLRVELGYESQVVIDGQTFTLCKFLDEYAGISVYLATLDGCECVVVRKHSGDVWWYYT